MTQEVADRLGGPLAYLGAAVASSGEGHGFLDNYLPMPRRGGAFYHNTETGRAVVLSGCDLGNGVLVEGEGELIWVGPGLAPERNRFCQSNGVACLDAFRWKGSLLVTLEGSGAFQVRTFEVSDLVTDVAGNPVAASVRFDEFEVSVADEELYATMFRPADLSRESLPNPTHSLRALTGADLDRLAFHAGMDLLGFMINELDFSDNHTHQVECGTIDVVYDEDRIPTAIASWNDCSGDGLFQAGNFTLEFTTFQLTESNPVLELLVSGDLSLGGGVPTVDLTRWVWRLDSPGGDPGERIRVSMTLADADEERTYSRTVLVDD